jgi:hypothetical protein
MTRIAQRTTGRHDIALLGPRSFDPEQPDYRPAVDMQMISALPIGTRLRIERLIKGGGVGGLLWVTGSLIDDEKTGYVERALLARNRFITPGYADRVRW